MPLFITEFSAIASDNLSNLLPLPKEPAVANQTVAIGGSSAQSAIMNASTRFVRVHTDVNCHIAVGVNPTATTSSRRMAAGQTEYVHIANETGDSIRIAVIAGT